MAKINILPPSVYNRIAAGEVIERPYSVVKELVENSIDAGATEIEIYVEQGGKQLVRVVDNGCGIARDDLQSAFMSHATSKISKAEDLNGIVTLGFRGEAVASIASVSKMTITSKTQDGKCYSLTSDGGKLGEVTEAASTATGTDARVEMLFFNIPVRREFLKSDKAEEADITTFVSRFILNRSDIAFTYYADGKKVLQSFGDGDEAAMVSVYGASVLRDCYQIQAEKHGIRIRGYIGSQNFSKPNKSYQSVFLNGRYVLNTTVAASISGAYASYLMKRQYPFYVLHIDMPPQIVDANVHPNKTDVRFASNQTVYGCIHSVISAVLDGKPQALEYVVKAPYQPLVEDEPVQTTTTKTPAKAQNTPIAGKTLSESILEKEAEEKPAPKTNKYSAVFDDLSLSYEKATEELKPYVSHFAANTPAPETSETEKQDEVKPETPPTDGGFIPMSEIGDFDASQLVHGSFGFPPVQPRRRKDPEKLHEKFPDRPFTRTVFRLEDTVGGGSGAPYMSIFDQNKLYLSSLDGKTLQEKIDAAHCRYVGKLFNTYLLYEYGDDVYMIDQHAAHERLIYDSLKRQMEVRYVVRQPMLVPFELKLNAFEATFIREQLDTLWDIGFTINEVGDTGFSVTEIPVDLQDIDLNRFFNEILGDISGYRAIKLEELLKDKLATAACKMAVKGGMDLSDKEVEELLTQMGGDMTLKCPHGRPAVIRTNKKQIEKKFKRIL